MQLIYAEETYTIRGAVYEVCNTLGSGFLEAVYQEALELEFASRKIPYAAQKELPVFYKRVRLRQFYKADFICYDKIIVELKAVKQLLPEHEAQLHNYLCATGKRLGLLVNFASSPVEIRRIVH